MKRPIPRHPVDTSVVLSPTDKHKQDGPFRIAKQKPRKPKRDPRSIASFGAEISLPGERRR